jgi:hypothetical protein
VARKRTWSLTLFRKARGLVLYRVSEFPLLHKSEFKFQVFLKPTSWSKFFSKATTYSQFLMASPKHHFFLCANLRLLVLSMANVRHPVHRPIPGPNCRSNRNRQKSDAKGSYVIKAGHAESGRKNRCPLRSLPHIFWISGSPRFEKLPHSIKR